MKILSATVIAFLLLAASANAKTIKIGDDWFGSPSTELISAKKGEKITFRWTGKRPHNAVVKKGPAKWNSGVKIKGKKSWTPPKKGKYKMVCTLHSGMDFTLRVR